jgi:chaperonin cofactor prefoldin
MESQQMEILSDLVRYLSNDAALPAVMSAVRTEPYYRLCFEAAEVRYARMKALVCASLERQAQLQNERCSLEISGLMKRFRINGMDNATILWNTLNELKASKEEADRLREMNRCRDSPMPELPQTVVIKDWKTEGELQTARQRIGTLELELMRMADQQFEIEERVREYQDVIDNLVGQEHVAADPVHPRYHPINTCTSAACQNYVKRLRGGLRQAVADAYVRDRSVRIHGFFQRVVLPIEELRAEKDACILLLQSRLARLECATLRRSDDVATVSEDMVKHICEIERLKADVDAVRMEHQALQQRKGDLAAELRASEQDVQEARDVLDDASEKRSLCKAEAHCLEKERAHVERMWERVLSFKDGRMAADYDRMLREYQTLEYRLEVVRQEGVERMDEDDAPVKRVGNVVFTVCRCGQSVPVDEIGRHIVSLHPSKDSDEVTPCPAGCGFFANDGLEMAAHVRGSECAGRVRAIKRLKDSGV